MTTCNSNPKIVSLEQLADLVERARQQGLHRVIHCHGVFDLLHLGHIEHLQAARRLGEMLVVTITPDRLVNKGPGRPIFPELERCRALAALECVSYVAINQWPTAVETLTLLKPYRYVKGREYCESSQDVTGNIDQEVAAVRAAGGDIAYTDEVVFSSSHLINRHVDPHPPEVQEFLAGFCQQHRFEDIRRYVEGASRLKVLVVGEAIIDEYQYCEAIGKSSKEPTLVAKRGRLERFAGGIVAVANHVANFAGQVSMLTVLGRTNSQQEFIESHLAQGVEPHYVWKSNGPTIVKRRYVEEYFFQKLFEIYELNDTELAEAENQDLCQQLERLLPLHDVVIVVDYGHGFLSREAIELLGQRSRFLAINAQCNAGNQGYHTVSLYPRADFVATTEKELRMEARRRSGDLEEMVQQVYRKLSAQGVSVTRGSRGCIMYDEATGITRVPAIADKVVDRIGAGDAFLSAAALCAAQGAPMPVVGLVGNAAGAQAVATLCNEGPVRRTELLRHLQILLK